MRNAARALVVFGVLAWTGLLFATFTAGPYTLVWCTTLVVFFVAWILTRIASRDLAEKRAADLDEYETALRNRARNSGYWTAILGGTALFILTSIFAIQARDGDITLLSHSPVLILALILAASAAPTAALAWNARSHGGDDA